MFMEGLFLIAPNLKQSKCLPTNEWLNYDEYVHYLDDGDGFQSYTYAKTCQIVHFKRAVYCMTIVYQ